MKTNDLLRVALFSLQGGRIWTKGAYGRDYRDVPTLIRDDVHKVCGIGALRFIAFNDIKYQETHEREAAYIHALELLDRAVQFEPCDVTTGYFVHWQDRPETEFEEVRLKFLEAIAHAEIEERSTT